MCMCIFNVLCDQMQGRVREAGFATGYFLASTSSNFIRDNLLITPQLSGETPIYLKDRHIQCPYVAKYFKAAQDG